MTNDAEITQDYSIVALVASLTKFCTYRLEGGKSIMTVPGRELMRAYQFQPAHGFLITLLSKCFRAGAEQMASHKFTGGGMSKQAAMENSRNEMLYQQLSFGLLTVLGSSMANDLDVEMTHEISKGVMTLSMSGYLRKLGPDSAPVTSMTLEVPSYEEVLKLRNV